MQHQNSQLTWSSLYQPLEPASHHFRILTLHRGNSADAIRCSLKTVSLEDTKRQYHALSYRWGHENDRKQITVNGIPLSVTVNLHTALKHLRFIGADRDLWIDQICINQGDKDEKLHQISLMKPIYAESHQVIIWLGESDRHLEKLSNLLSTTGFPSRLTKTPEPGTDEAFGREIQTIYHLVLHMCHREWWRRVWVVQECVSSVNPPVFQCGGSSFTFGQLDELFEALMSRPNYLKDSGGDDAELQKALEVSEIPTTDLLRPLQNMLDLRQMLDYTPQRTISLIDCLQLPVGRSATDPHDYVYGFLGLMPPDESQELILNLGIPARELFHKFMTLALRSAMQNDTLGCYQALRLISFEKKDDSAGPSWVPDLSAQSFSDRNNSVYLIPLVPVKTQFHPQIWFESNDAVMNMVGFHLDTVTHTQPLTSGEHGLSKIIANHQNLAAQPRKRPGSYFRRIFPCRDASNNSERKSRLGFRRLFTCNFRLNSFPNEPEVLDELWGLWIQSEVGHTKWSRKELDRMQRSLGTDVVRGVFEEFHERSSTACEGRAWFRTNNNFLGIAVPRICVEDIVVLPRGFVMPLVLRPSAGWYKLIGGAYVDGLVEDGAVDKLVIERGIAEKTWKLG